MTVESFTRVSSLVVAGCALLLTACRPAAEKTPQTARSLRDAGIYHLQSGELTRARTLLEAAVAADADDARANYELGVCLFQQVAAATGGFDSALCEKAVAQFTQASALRPTFAAAYAMRGMACEMLGRVDEARTAYQAFLKNNKNSNTKLARRVVGRCQVLTGDR